MIEDVELVGNGKTGREKMADGADYIRRLHVFALDVVLVDEQNATVGAPLRLPIIVKVMEVFGFLVISA